MRVAIVYESLYGNTHEAAKAIATGVLDARPDVRLELFSVGEADAQQVADADLLIVGGPTHMRGMSSGMSRKMAVTGEAKKDPEQRHDLEPDAEGPGIRDWFHQLPRSGGERFAAAFDTRIHGRLAGGAATGIERRLRRHGYDVIAEPEGFFVQDNGEGPLKDGEMERARSWGADVVEKVAVTA